MTLTNKQRCDTAEWEQALAVARKRPPIAEAKALVEEAAADVRRRLRMFGHRPAFAWSGGKDSLVLQAVAEAAGIGQGVLVISDLEYPAFLAWATDHMPHGLAVVARGWDLGWLAGHPEMLFPKNAAVAGKWFAGVQHWGQRFYCARRDVDVLLLGRRRADGNFVGRGTDAYRDKAGFVRWSPLAAWTNEQVITVIAGLDLDLPPNYFWPRGFRVGTGPWPARQWTDGVMHGWSEVFEIDPSVVRSAARAVPSARAFLESDLCAV